MPIVRFTSHLQRHVPCPPETVEAGTVRAALEAYFLLHPGVRSYVFDEQGNVRRHVVVFVDGRQADAVSGYAEAVEATTEVFVMQALSGG
ncbi:MAG: MoaD/ThiS family protein [Polyangiaceae bacterium]